VQGSSLIEDSAGCKKEVSPVDIPSNTKSQRILSGWIFEVALLARIPNLSDLALIALRAPG
jgi:hypothetical protein